MASNKILRINEDIQRVLSDRLRQIKDPRVTGHGLVTVVNVDTSGDLRWCKVYLSVMGEINEKEFKKGLKSASGWLRRELGSALDLRYTPELVFTLDKSIEYGAHISQVLNSLDIKSEEDEQNGAEY